MKILIVGGARGDRCRVREIFEADSIYVCEASTGTGALPILQRTPPDAILVVGTMQTADRRAFYRDVRQGDSLREIPVILIANEASKPETSALPFTDADQVIAETVPPERLIVAVREAVAERRSAFSSGRSVVDPHAAHLRVVADNLAEGLLISDLDGNLLYWNRAALLLHGFDETEESRRILPDLPRTFALYTLDGTVLRPDQWPLARISKGEPLQGFEARIRRREGEWERIFSYSGGIVTEAGGRRLAFVSIFDITERQGAIRKVRETNAQLQHLITQSSAVVYTLELDSIPPEPRVGSENITALLGVSVADTLNPKWYEESIHPDDRVRVLAAIATLRVHKNGVHEYRMRHRDGSYRWIEDTARVVMSDASGNSGHVVGTWTEITERKRAGDILHQANQERRERRQTAAIKDGVGVIAFGTLIFLAGYFLRTFDRPLLALLDHQENAFDEAVATFIILGPLFVIFGVRRWRESGEPVKDSGGVGDAASPGADALLRRRRLVFKDLAILGLCGLLLFGVVRYFYFLTPLVRWTWEHRDTPIDEVFGTIIMLSPALAFFAYRRWSETKEDVDERRQTAESLHALHEELDQRVRRRTAELAEANEALRAEIDERRKLEAEVTVREQRLNAFFTGATAGLALFDRDLKYIQINDTLAEMNGRSRADHLGRTMKEIVPDLARLAEPSLREVLATNQPIHNLEVTGETARRPGGQGYWIESLFPVRGDTDEPVGVGAIVVEITERKKAELRLKLQQSITAVLAEAPSLPVAYQRILRALCEGLDSEFGELWIVDRAAKVLRCPETWHAANDDLRAFSASTKNTTLTKGLSLPGRVWESGQCEWIFDLEADGGFARKEEAAGTHLKSWVGFPIVVRKEILGVVGFFSTRAQLPDDEMRGTLTAFGAQLGQFIERQQLTEQFRQAQKMEAVGTLAGGIAHDFNNIIAAISGYTELTKLRLGDASPVAEYLSAIMQAATRAGDLVRQILAFTRQQEQQRKLIQLRYVVSEAVRLLRATIPANVEFDISLESRLPAVLADATQVHQIVMNLATNAWHAMKGRPGRMSVRLEACDVSEDMAALHPGLQPGPYVRLSISDTGHGMDAATVSRIFEPFFTTKAPGEGTGLGLSVVHGIMQSHEGVITVYSQPGEGTTFQLYFPSSSGEAFSVADGTVVVPRGANERILYVDDEKPLANMAQRILERLGYLAESRTDPREALELFRADPHRFDLVITDLAMPVMGGTDLAKELLSLRPDIPIILITGYTATLTAARVRDMGMRDLLLKPTTLETLGVTVHRVLAEAKKT